MYMYQIVQTEILIALKQRVLLPINISLTAYEIEDATGCSK